VPLSTTEAELTVLTEAVKEALWVKSFVVELGLPVTDVLVWCDNQGAIQLSKSQVFHNRSISQQNQAYFCESTLL
jgi:hypothetical protein